MAKELTQTEKVRRRIERLIDREIYFRETALVEDLLRLQMALPHSTIEQANVDFSDFRYDEIENNYTEFNSGEPVNVGTCENCGEEGVELDEDLEVCEDCYEPEPKEIYEWWRVTPWFAGKLRDAGEPILANHHGNWWGRCTTGQAISLDYIIIKLAKEFYS